MSTAMEFVKAHKGGGGRFYLTAKLLKANKGLTGTIAAKPYVESVTFGDEEKDVFRLPVDLDQEVEVPTKDGKTVSRTDALFNPGTNAVKYLIDELGADDESWVGKAGKFERRELEDSSFFPWFFVPTGASKPSNRTASFKCGMCPKSFKTIGELQAHQSDVHGP